MLFDVKHKDNFLTKTHAYHEISYHSRQIKIRVSVAFNRDTHLQICAYFGPKRQKKQSFKKHSLRIQQYLINQVNVSAITIYPGLFGTRLIGTRPTQTRLIGTLKIDRVQLERVSLARNLPMIWHHYSAFPSSPIPLPLLCAPPPLPHILLTCQLRRSALRFFHSHSGATGVFCLICQTVYFRCAANLIAASGKICVRRLRVGDLLIKISLHCALLCLAFLVLGRSWSASH